MSKSADPFLEKFAEDVAYYLPLMSEAYDGVIDEGVSKYPVFVFHQQEVSIGLMIADRFEVAGEWSVNISTLEEFYIKGLVTIEQVDEIKSKITGSKPQYCCLVLTAEKGQMIFLPRQTVS